MPFETMPKPSYFLLLAALRASATTLSAQLVDDYNPPRAACCLIGTAQNLVNQLQDWNQLGRYHADDEKLKAQPAEPGRVSIPRRFHHRWVETSRLLSPASPASIVASADKPPRKCWYGCTRM